MEMVGRMIQTSSVSILVENLS